MKVEFQWTAGIWAAFIFGSDLVTNWADYLAQLAQNERKHPLTLN